MEKVKKILILGSSGMLGHVLLSYLSKFEEYELHDITFKTKTREKSIICDVTNSELLENIIADIKPFIIVNCIGVLINGANENPANAIYINSYLPNYLSNLAKTQNFHLIHISTDCVFSGKEGNYTESDFKDSDTIYGRTKALGELNNSRDLTLRTSIIGPELKLNGEGLFHWFMSQKNSISGFTNVYWNGITTYEMAKVVHYCITNEKVGLINVCNTEKISKHQLLSIFKSTFKIDSIEISAIKTTKSDKSLICTIDDFNFEFKSYHQMILEMKNYMNQNSIHYRKNYLL